jgi:hydroxymethylpyrimidine pyrophosphatase-like HAD family hydrolase
VAVPLEHGLLEHGRVSGGAVAACRAAAEAGCRVIITTGRPPRGTRSTVEMTGVSPTVVTCNGALIWSHVDGGPVHHEALDASVAAEAIAAVRAVAPDCLVGIDRLDRWFTDRVAEEPAGDEAGASAAPDGVGPLEQFLNAPVTQVDVLAAPSDVALVRTALDPLVQTRRIARYERPGGLFQLTSPRAERAVALQRIAKGAGLDRAEVMAVGGGRHDAGMVEWAGFSAVLADAPEPVRRLADVVVPARDDGGLARALARYVVSGPAAPESATPESAGD